MSRFKIGKLTIPKRSYTIILEPAEEGGYNVSVPALPGCYTQGDNFEHAAAMAQDAISLWLEETELPT